MDRLRLPARAPVAVLLAVASAFGGCRAIRPEPRGEPASAVGSASLAAAADPDVRALASPDFVVRSGAAERLVARGEAALPALGAAEDARVEAHGRVAVHATRPVVAAILAGVPMARVEGAWLRAEAAVLRRGAADEIGRRGARGPVPALIERLDDDDPGVRAACLAALRRLTNRVLEDDASASVVARTATLARWREWWEREGRLVAPTAGSRSG